MGRLQKIPPAAPRASSVTNDARLLFGNPNVAPNKGIIDVRNPVDYISGGKIHNSVNVPIQEIINWCNANEEINYD